MRDTKAVVLGVVLVAAGVVCGLRANAIGADRAAFDAAYRHKYNDFKRDANGHYLTPSSEEDYKHLTEMMERGGAANQWWTFSSVPIVVGVMLIGYGVLGTARKKTDGA